MNLSKATKRAILSIVAMLVLVAGILQSSGTASAAGVVEKTISCAGGSVTFSYTTQASITNLSSKPAWLSVSSKLNSATSVTYTISASANPNCGSRSFDLYFSGTGETYRITQYGLGHSYTVYEKTPATCTSYGHECFKCSRCNSRTQGNQLPMADHSYKIKRVEPTYTSTGYEKKYCTVCGKEAYNKTLAKLKVSVVFEKNNGEGFETKSMEAGKAYSYWPSVGRSGYIFKGWQTSSGKKVVQTDKVPAQSSITLYAQWEKISLKFSKCSPGNNASKDYKSGSVSLSVTCNTDWNYHFVGSASSSKKITRPDWVEQESAKNGTITFKYKQNDTGRDRTLYLCVYTGKKTDNPASDRIKIWYKLTQKARSDVHYNSVLFISEFIPEVSYNKNDVNKYVEGKYSVSSSKVDTKTFEVKNKDTFKSVWSKMPDKQDVVVINTHGEPDRFITSNANNPTKPVEILSTSDVNSLASKEIKIIILLGCNTGHADYTTNMATEFRKKFNCTVIAPDGTDVYNHQVNSNNYWYTAASTMEWNRWCINAGSSRILSEYDSEAEYYPWDWFHSYGWLVYSKDGKIKKYSQKSNISGTSITDKDLDERRLTVYEMLNRYNNNKIYDLSK